VKHYGLRSINSLIIFRGKEDCLSSGRSAIFYRFTIWATKLTAVIIRGISLLFTSYRIIFSIFHSRLTPYIEEVTGDHMCGFQSNRSTTDQIFYIRQILEKKWEYNESVHQLLLYFKKDYDSVRREVLYNILIEFGVSTRLARLIETCLNETYSKVRIGKYLSDISATPVV
jgi:hypothetical protein